MLDISEIRAEFLKESITILEPLAQGGMADVFKAKQDVMDRLVAVKVLRLTEESDLTRFQNEARVLGTLNHPSIVKTLSFGILPQSRCPYMVLEFIDGITLAKEMETGPFSLKRFRSVFIPLLSALSYAHEKGLVHRDVKPSNVMVGCEADGSEFVKLLDFGIARVIQDEGSEAQNLTRTGTLLGSPSYMSPEQCKGQPLNNKSDIYSLSCVMFEALYGRPVFEANSALEIMSLHVNGSPPTMADLRRNFDSSDRLSQLILAGLAKEPDSRPTAAEFTSKLQRILDSTTLSRVPRLRTPASNNSKLMLLILGLSLLFAAVTGKVYFDRARTNSDPSVNMQEKDLGPSTLWSRGKALEQQGHYLEAMERYQAALNALGHRKHHDELNFLLNSRMADCCSNLYVINNKDEQWYEKANNYASIAWNYSLDHFADSERERGNFMDACRIQCGLRSMKKELEGTIPNIVAEAEKRLKGNTWELLEVEGAAYVKLLDCGRLDLAESLIGRMQKQSVEFGSDSYPYVKVLSQKLVLLSKKGEFEEVRSGALALGRQLILAPGKTFTSDRRLNLLANAIFMALSDAKEPSIIEELILYNDKENPKDKISDAYQYAVCYLRLGSTYVEMKNWKKAIPPLQTCWSNLKMEQTEIRPTQKSCLDLLVLSYSSLGLAREAEQYRRMREKL